MRISIVLGSIVMAASIIGSVYISNEWNRFYIQTDGLKGYRLDKKTGKTWKIYNNDQTLVPVLETKIILDLVNNDNIYMTLDSNKKIKVLKTVKKWNENDDFFDLDIITKTRLIKLYIESLNNSK